VPNATDLLSACPVPKARTRKEEVRNRVHPGRTRIPQAIRMGVWTRIPESRIAAKSRIPRTRTPVETRIPESRTGSAEQGRRVARGLNRQVAAPRVPGRAPLPALVGSARPSGWVPRFAQAHPFEWAHRLAQACHQGLRPQRRPLGEGRRAPLEKGPRPLLTQARIRVQNPLEPRPGSRLPVLFRDRAGGDLSSLSQHLPRALDQPWGIL
jgi:hypothetical protein